MRKTIRNIFVPTEENGFVPGVLSLKVFLPLVVIAVAFLVSPTIYKYRQAALLAGSNGYSAEEIIALANTNRKNVGLNELKVNPVLNKAADVKVQDMLAKNYFSHVSPDNKTPWDFIKGAGYKYFAAGENLAIDFVTAEDVNKGLMDSPTHRANLLNKLYTEIGVSVGYGIFDGRETILVAQYFGKPYEVKTAPAPIKPVTVPVKPATTTKPSIAEEASKVTQKILDSTPEVLGESQLTQAILSEIDQEFLSAVTVFVSREVLMRLFSAFAVLMTTVSFFFMIIRGFRLGTNMILRTLILVLAFGYVLFNGSGSVVLARVSPISFSTVSIEQAK